MYFHSFGKILQIHDSISITNQLHSTKFENLLSSVWPLSRIVSDF